LAVFLALATLSACMPLSLNIPAVADATLESLVRNEAFEIVRVSENSHQIHSYRFLLADFPRKDILGLSIGKQRIFVSYQLARLASQNEHYRWLLRQTLAHEIAHDVLGAEGANHEPGSGHNPGLANRISARDLGLSGIVSFRPYSKATELLADKKGIEYWRLLGWDCRNWVRILDSFIQNGYHGDVDHPTVERFKQALELCPAATSNHELQPAKILS
jgi:predicted Zn-dependent protease